jgi:hypothetical protein
MTREVPHKLNAKDVVGDPEGIVHSPDHLLNHASLVLLVKTAADLLEKHYSGWAWAIEPDEFGGVINIYSLKCSGDWGYTLKISSLQHDPHQRRLIRAAGELLERFGFQAGRYDREAWAHKSRHLGQIAADVSDLKTLKQRNYRTHQLQVGLQNGSARVLTDEDLRGLHAGT